MKKFFSNLLSDARSNPHLFVMLLCMVLMAVLYFHYLSAQVSTIPLAPSNLVVTAQSTSSITLAWQDNSNNEDKFNIERKLSTDPSFLPLGQVGTNVETYLDTSSIVSGLTYNYQVQACLTDIGCSESATLTVVAGAPILPLAPSDLTAEATTSAVLLTWTDNSNNENQFIVERKLSSDSSFTPWAEINGDQTSYLDSTSIASGIILDYRVKACILLVDCSDYTYLSGVVIPPLPVPIPAAPSGLSLASSDTFPTVHLEWTDNSENENKFIIERKLDTEPDYSFLAQVGTDINTFNDESSIATGLIFDYQIKACFDDSCSDYTTLSGVRIRNISSGGSSSGGSGGGTSSGGSDSGTTSGEDSQSTTSSENISSPGNTLPTSEPSLVPIENPVPDLFSQNTSTSSSSDTSPSTEQGDEKNIEAEQDSSLEIDTEEVAIIFETISQSTEIPNGEVVKMTDLLFLDSNNDGISDYDSIYVYHLDPKKPSPTSVYQGKTIKAGEKVLLGLDPTNSEIIKIVVEDPTVSKAPIVSAYRVEEITMNENKEIVLKGKALPNSYITLYLYSTPIVVTVKTDSNGEWQYVLDQELEDGKHTVYTATVNNTGKILAKSSGSIFSKTAEAVTLEDLPPINASSEVEKPGLLNRGNIYLFLGGILTIFVLVFILTGILSKKKNLPQ